MEECVEDEGEFEDIRRKRDMKKLGTWCLLLILVLVEGRWGELPTAQAANQEQEVTEATKAAEESMEVFTGDVSLTKVGKIKATSFISGTNLVPYRDMNGSWALMDLNGNRITEALYTEDFSGTYGWIIATLNDESGSRGLLGRDGGITIPFRYQIIKVFGENWAFGMTVKETASEDYLDYAYLEDFSMIDSIDIYYLTQEDGTLAGTLAPDTIVDVSAVGDYLIVQDNDGSAVAYDASMNTVYTWDPLGKLGIYAAINVMQLRQMGSTEYAVFNVGAGYAEFFDRDVGKAGLVDYAGNVVIPAQFQNILMNLSGKYVSGGYFFGELDGDCVYFTEDGTVTCTIPHKSEALSNYGISAYYQALDGGYTLYSADGVETDLGTTYDFLQDTYLAEGMFWEGSKPGSGYDLLDWHGNVLLSGYSGYSLSENGGYLIATTYHSSTLYRVNDAPLVNIAEGDGGLPELEEVHVETVSLDPYTGDSQVELVGRILNRKMSCDFVEGTDLLMATDDGENYALYDLDGQQLTEAVYSDFRGVEGGWIFARRKGTDGGGNGVLTENGEEIIPCRYDGISSLNETWILTSTEQEEEGVVYEVYHVSEEGLTSKKFTNVQMYDIDMEARGDYLNVKDGVTDTVITYDSTFCAVAVTDYLFDFSGYDSRKDLVDQLEASFGYNIFGIECLDGYFEYKASGDSIEEDRYGLIDGNGNVVLPAEYSEIETYYSQEDFSDHYCADGYFTVFKDGKAGFVTEGGQVSCELKYDEEGFLSAGMSAIYTPPGENRTNSVLVAADGVETARLQGRYTDYGNGKLWKIEELPTESTEKKERGTILIDWHSNVLFQNCREILVSSDGRFIIVRKGAGGPLMLYAVDGASVDETDGYDVKSVSIMSGGAADTGG